MWPFKKKVKPLEDKAKNHPEIKKETDHYVLVVSWKPLFHDLEDVEKYHLDFGLQFLSFSHRGHDEGFEFLFLKLPDFNRDGLISMLGQTGEG